MPELPEVETTKTSLFPLLNQKVQSVEVRNSSLRLYQTTFKNLGNVSFG